MSDQDRARRLRLLQMQEQARRERELQAQQQQEGGNSLSGIASAAGSGLLRGVSGLADMPGAMASMGANLGERAARAMGFGDGVPEGAAAQMFSQVPVAGMATLGDGSQMRGLMDDFTGGYSEQRGNTGLERIAGTVAEFLPGAAVFGGVSPSNLIRYGAVPGAASELAGMATEGTDSEPYARMIAALTAPAALNAAEGLVRRVISPNAGADPARLAAAGALESRGIDVSAGQRVGNDILRRREGYSRAGEQMFDRQSEQFTSAAMRSIGSSSNRATPDALRAAADDIGATFDRVLGGTDIVPDQNMVAAMRQAANEYALMAPSAARVPVIDNIVDLVDTAASNGIVLNGRDVASWRTRLNRMVTSPDPAAREAARVAIQAIDDATNTALQQAGRADDIAQLATARQQWRDFLAIQRAASGAGEDTAAGLLSPSALRNAVATQGRSAYAQGRRGGLGDLAREGEMVLRRPSTSGTAENQRAMGGIATALAAVPGATVGSAYGAIPAAAGALATSLLPAATRWATTTRPIQYYLANQLVAPSGPVFRQGQYGPIVSALMAEYGQ